MMGVLGLLLGGEVREGGGAGGLAGAEGLVPVESGGGGGGVAGRQAASGREVRRRAKANARPRT